MAEKKPPDAFLSYTRFDDRQGDISAFREWLSDAVREVAGEPFEIFQDFDGIGIGEHWPGKLGQMLDEVRFLIPILTPSYFNSLACRNELEKFLNAERERGRSDLILPIYYIECDILENRNLRATDPLAETLYERQREDWRELRYDPFQTPEVKRRLGRLAREIWRRAKPEVMPEVMPEAIPDGARTVMPNATDGQRRFFRARDAEIGRHASFRQPLDGEYAFRLDQGGQEPLDTYNAATKELQAMIAECLRDDAALRARGSLWSLSPVAVTEGRLIDTKALRLGFDLPASLVDPNYAGNGGRLRFLECGNSIDAVNRYLFRDRLSLKASGSNNGQTLAGALSTGTHGGAFNVGAIPEMVVGLHLVTGPGKHVYVERRSQPVMKPSFAQSLGADFVQDDALFNAALVSFGSFGVIHGIMIEARELFILNALRFSHPFDAGLKKAISTLDFSDLQLPAAAAGVPQDKPYHFEIFYNPNEGTPPAEAIVLMMFEEPWTESYEPLEWDASDAGPGASGLDVMGALLEIIPEPLTPLVVPILNGQVRDQYAPYNRKGIIRDLFRGEKTLGKTLGCGVGLPLSHALEGLDIAFRVYRDSGDLMPIILSHRFVKGSTATLGFTRFDPTAVLEIDAINTPNTQDYLQRVWAELDAAGVPFTLHWGKFNSHLTPERVRTMYGATAVDEWIASRNTLFESPEVAKVFANAFITGLQLDG